MDRFDIIEIIQADQFYIDYLYGRNGQGKLIDAVVRAAPRKQFLQKLLHALYQQLAHEEFLKSQSNDGLNLYDLRFAQELFKRAARLQEQPAFAADNQHRNQTPRHKRMIR